MRYLLPLLLAAPLYAGEIQGTSIDIGSLATPLIPDTTNPTLASALIDGDKLTLRWSESVWQGGSWDPAELTIDMTSQVSDSATTYVSGDGTTKWVFSVENAAISTDTVTLDFTGVAGVIEDSSGNSVATIVGGAVTNNTFGGGGGYLVSEDFDGADVVPAGWTDTGSCVWNSTLSPAPLVGTGSLLSVDNAYVDFADTSEAWVYFIYNSPNVGPMNPWVALQTSGGTNVAYIRSINSADLRGYCTTTLQTAVGAEAAATTYHVWIHYKKGTGSDAIFRVWHNTTDTRPASPVINISDGDATGDVGRLEFADRLGDDKIDKVRISTSEIGNSPL